MPIKFLVLLLFPALAGAVTVQAEWEWPTTRVNGMPITLSEFQSINALYGTCSADNTALASILGEWVIPPPATTTTFDAQPGDLCLLAWVVDTDLVESERALFTFKVPDKAPSNSPVMIAFRALPDPPVVGSDMETYSAQGYQSTAVRMVVDGVLKKAPGSNTVKVGAPCDCTKQDVTDTAGARWCSVGGQLQMAWNTDPTGVPRGEEFPDNYAAMCREVQP